MATQVPIVPGIDATPRFEPLSRISVDTPLAAFGGAVAEAEQRMGATVEGAGKELFNTAKEFQTQDNQSMANIAYSKETDFMVQKLEELNQKQGLDRAAALPAYFKDVEENHAKVIASLPNKQAQQMADNDGRRTMTMMKWHAASSANEARTSANKESMSLRRDAITDAVVKMDPANGEAVNAALKEVDSIAESAVVAAHGVKGFEPGTPQHDAAKREFMSPAVKKVISAHLGANPEEGYALAYKLGNMLTGPDRDEVLKMADQTLQNKIVPKIGTAAANGVGIDLEHSTFGRGIVEDALKVGNGSYSYAPPDVVRDGVNLGHPVGMYGVGSKVLPGLLAKYGHPGVSEADFLANPQLQDELASHFVDVQKEQKGFDAGLKAWSGGTADPSRMALAYKKLAGNIPEAEMNRRVGAAVDAKYPKIPDAITNAVDAKDKHLVREQKVATATQFQAFSRLQRLADGSIDPNAPRPTSLDDLYKSADDARDSYAGLDDKHQDTINKILEQNLVHGEWQENPKGDKVYEDVMNKLVHPGATPQELQAALDFAPGTAPLTKVQRQNILKAQDAVMRNQNASPRMAHALGLGEVKAIMASGSIDKTIDPDRYNAFITKLHDAMEYYQVGSHQSLKDADDTIVKIAKDIATQGPSGYLSRGPQLWEHPFQVDTNAKNAATAAFIEENHREPTDKDMADLEADYLRMRYTRLGAMSRPQAKRTNRVPTP